MESPWATILVVDDEERIRDFAREALMHRGYKVLTARNSVEALLLADHHAGTIELLITDLSMPPYMDGVELAKALQEVRPNLRVLFISADPPDPLIQSELRNGRIAYLGKPFPPETLASRVRQILVVPGPPAGGTRPGDIRTILMMVPEGDVRSRVAGLLREEDYLVLEVRNIGEAITACEWHVGGIGLLLADRKTLDHLPSELRERLSQIRPEMRVLCASTSAYGGDLEAPLGERVKRALEEWGLEARGGP